MLRNILIPLDPSDYTRAAVELATTISAQVRQALGRDAVTLSGLGIVDLDQIPTGRFANMVPKDELLAEARGAVEQLIAGFRKQAQDAGVPEALIATHHTEGSPFAKIIHHHVFSDLIVMGETCSFPPVHNDYQTMEHLFHQASRPVLITPAKAPGIEAVVMAMDGTAAASRMMYAYAHLNPFPKARLVLAHSREEEDQHNLKDFFRRVEEYLSAFGYTIERKLVEGHMLDGLPKLAEAEQAGAIAIGVPAEHFMDRLRNPLALRLSSVEKLVSETNRVLFTVH